MHTKKYDVYNIVEIRQYYNEVEDRSKVISPVVENEASCVWRAFLPDSQSGPILTCVGPTRFIRQTNLPV